MTEQKQKKIHLCGGTLFNILLLFRKDRYTQMEHAQGKRSGVAEPDILNRLVCICFPKKKMPTMSTSKTNTTQYKNCRIEASHWLSFDNDVLIDEFKDELSTNYARVLKRACLAFSECFRLDSQNNIKVLGRYLLDWIYNDDGIPSDAEFYLSVDGKTVRKKDIDPNQTYNIQSILLGLWAYIVTNKVSNKAGEKGLERMIKECEKLGSPFAMLHRINDYFNNTAIILLSSNDINLDESKETPISTAYDFTSYIQILKAKYGMIKTLLYVDAPRPFYDFYVCNDLSMGSFSTSATINAYHQELGKEPSLDEILNITNGRISAKILTNSTAELLLKIVSNYIIITGTGGLGKSMMMRHLMLNSASDYDTYHKIPVFIQLKDFNDSYSCLLDFAFEKINELCNCRYDDFIDQCRSGNVIFQFDGYDEIKSDYVELFDTYLDALTDRYSGNMYILSSRPDLAAFVRNSKFSVLNLLPFDKGKALSLITKLKYYPEEPSIKQHFMECLDKELFRTHKEFAENPLLLTIMMMTFQQYADIPSKMYLFYHEAYETLAQKHDASKGLKRALKTGLSTEQFEDYLEEFCARTYHKEKYEFTEQEFKNEFRQMNIYKKEKSQKVTANSFLTDLKDNICLLYCMLNR